MGSQEHGSLLHVWAEVCNGLFEEGLAMALICKMKVKNNTSHLA